MTVNKVFFHALESVPKKFQVRKETLHAMTSFINGHFAIVSHATNICGMYPHGESVVPPVMAVCSIHRLHVLRWICCWLNILSRSNSSLFLRKIQQNPDCAPKEKCIEMLHARVAMGQKWMKKIAAHNQRKVHGATWTDATFAKIMIVQVSSKSNDY